MFQFISPPMPHFTVCGEDTYPIGGRHPNRSSIGLFDLLIVTRGCLYLEEEGLALTIPADHFALLRPDRSHGTAKPCDEETHFYWLHFQTLGSWSEETFASPPSPAPQIDQSPYIQIERFAHSIPRAGRLLSAESALDRLRKLLQLQAAPSLTARFRQQLGFQELLLQLGEEGREASDITSNQIADDAAAFLRRHYKKPLSYKQLSEELHFHANYIALCMKRSFGCTPLEYLTRHRVEQAKHLLVNTNEPIGTIAEETGFGSFPYFVRCFSRHTGFKPKAFRMRYR